MSDLAKILISCAGEIVIASVIARVIAESFFGGDDDAC